VKKIFVKIAGVIVNLLAAVGGLATFLAWAGIHPWDFKKMPIPSLPHWTWLIAAIILFGVSLRSTLLGIWRDLQPFWYAPSGQPSKSFDVVADFSIATNPVGPWSYGWSRNGLGNDFEPHMVHKTDICGPEVDGWGSPDIASTVWVMHNRTGQVIRGPEGTYTIPPDMLHMHPGQGGVYDIVRWTCPRRGKYTITGSFRRLNDQATTEDYDVNVVLNTTASLFPSPPRVLRGIGTQESFTFTGISLRADDKIDFIVGVGPGGSHGSDSTGLKAIILQ
jgi:hypothetical protein